MHVLITGASSGIGEALAREYAAHGAKVTLVARRLELLEKLAAELRKGGAQVHVIAHDLSVPEKAAEILPQAEGALGPIDVLVNNAGVQVIERWEKTDLARAEASLRTNLITPMRLTHAVLPAMLARRSGAIVDVSSVAALGPTPYAAWYSASKGGLAAASEALHGELRGTGVSVLTVYPGPVHTPMGDAGAVSYGGGAAVRWIPWGTTDVLAARIRKGVERGSARLVYPRLYWTSRWFPGITRWLLDRVTPAPKG
jgi:short-subunit dehydrogenase